MCQFSHLHVHTEYSLLDGLSNIRALYKKAVKENMPAIAITDHGNMFGVFKFVAEAYQHTNDKIPKVKPIVGCEFYVVKDRHIKNFTKDNKDRRCHQVLLAKNAIGYKNLMRLCSLGYIEGLYSKYPRIDKELIIQYSEGLIATTCCLAGSVPELILREGELSGELEFKWWLDVFGDDYYVELQRHGIIQQEKVNEVLIRFAKKYNVKIIASNDAHYVDRADESLHDILLCINTGEKVATPKMNDSNDDDENYAKGKRFGFSNDEFYLKSVDEMKTLFKDLPEAIDNTNEIVGKVELLNLKRDVLLPNFSMPSNFKTQYEYLSFLTWSGAKKRYEILTLETEERIKFELGVIEKMKFEGYFLIVADFIDAAKKIDVMVGPGRGSAAGSVVAYCLGITNIDPIKYQLLFERFLNPDRKSLPDIDTDFDDEGRQKVIDYVINKYGEDQVAQIVTYGSMAAKNSIKDVARVLDLPLQNAISLTKLVPNRPGIKLKNLLNPDEDGLKKIKELQADERKNVQELQSYYKDTSSPFYTVLNKAEQIDGTTRNIGVHAAGILIAPANLLDTIPICKVKDADTWVSQIDGEDIEKAGVIKMDFLGLKTLSIIKKAIRLIQHNQNITIDIDNIPLDDAATLKLYADGFTNGIFQFESDGMKKHLRDLKPDKFEDLIAMNALYRPGPMFYIPDFIKRKHGLQKVTYDLDVMQEFLQDTHGITVYQEQVMLLSQKIANFTKGDADGLRKIMGKKKADELAPVREKFLKQGIENKHDKKILEKIWDDWAKFAGYAFNKSHSTCYSLVSFQQAYLKVHFPKEFMAAVLDNASSDIEALGHFIDETKRMKIDILGPDVNESLQGFSVTRQGIIRFGLSAIKGLGDNVVEQIIHERQTKGKYESIFDFVARLEKKIVTKKSLEALSYSGALDTFSHPHRAQYFHHTNLDKILKYAQQHATSKEDSTPNLFFGIANTTEIKTPALEPCEEWTLLEKIKYEKEYTGMFLSGHPLNNFRFEFQHCHFTPIADIKKHPEYLNQINATSSTTFKSAGLIINAQHRVSKQGKKFGMITVEDYNDKIELAFFGEQYLRVEHLLKPETAVYFSMMYEKWQSSDDWKIRVNNLELLEDMRKKYIKELVIQLDVKGIQEPMIDFLKTYINNNKGTTQLKVIVQNTIQDDLVFQSNAMIHLGDDLINYLDTQAGIMTYRIVL